jgi:FHA domain
MELIYEFLRMREMFLPGDFAYELACPVFLFRRPPVQSRRADTLTSGKPFTGVMGLSDLLAKSNKKILSEAHEFRVFRLRPHGDRATLRIGRVSGNDLVLGVPSISQHHADAIVVGNEVRLVDRKSKNGTMIADKKLEPEKPVLLRSSDEVIFGTVPIQYMDPIALYDFLSTLTE